MPLSQIPDHIQERTTEKRKLEEDISKIAQEQLQAKATLEALHKKNSTLVQLEQFSDLKVELDKLYIPVEDIPRTVALIQGLRTKGYNVDTLGLLVSNWEASGAMQAELQKRIVDLTAAERDLRDRWERLTFLNLQKESLFKELQDMGCGLKELKVLSGIIREVAAERGIPDLNKYRSLKKAIEGLNQELRNLEGQIKRVESELISKPKEELHDVKQESATLP